MRLLAIALVPFLADAAPQSKPIEEAQLKPDYGYYDLESLEQVWDKAELVVRVRVIRQWPHDPNFPKTASTAKVLEVLKPYELLTTNEVTVVQVGGQVEKGDYILNVTNPNLPLFEVGAEYVLFLWGRQLTEKGPFFEVFNFEAAFKIEDGRILTHGFSWAVIQHQRRDATDFLQELRRLGHHTVTGRKDV